MCENRTQVYLLCTVGARKPGMTPASEILILFFDLLLQLIHWLITIDLDCKCILDAKNGAVHSVQYL